MRQMHLVTPFPPLTRRSLINTWYNSLCPTWKWRNRSSFFSSHSHEKGRWRIKSERLRKGWNNRRNGRVWKEGNCRKLTRWDILNCQFQVVGWFVYHRDGCDKTIVILLIMTLMFIVSVYSSILSNCFKWCQNKFSNVTFSLF